MENRTGVLFPPPLVPVVAIAAGAVLNQFIAPWPVGNGWMFAGGLLFGAAAGFAAWALLMMRKYRTTPSPFGAATTLLASGPYRISRNPIYLAMLGIQAGTALAFGLSATLALLPLSAWLLGRFVIRREESFLRATFPAEFAALTARVRRWL